MSRYIDAEKLCEGRVSNDPVVIAAMCEPTADVKEVVHGEWIKPFPTTIKQYTRICSVCKARAYKIGNNTLNFCPHCGADMRGDIKK